MRVTIKVYTSNNQHSYCRDILSYEEYKEAILDQFLDNDSTTNTFSNFDENKTFIFKNSEIREIEITWPEGVPEFVAKKGSGSNDNRT